MQRQYVHNKYLQPMLFTMWKSNLGMEMWSSITWGTEGKHCISYDSHGRGPEVGSLCAVRSKGAVQEAAQERAKKHAGTWGADRELSPGQWPNPTAQVGLFGSKAEIHKRGDDSWETGAETGQPSSFSRMFLFGFDSTFAQVLELSLFVYFGGRRVYLGEGWSICDSKVW